MRARLAYRIEFCGILSLSLLGCGGGLAASSDAKSGEVSPNSTSDGGRGDESLPTGAEPGPATTTAGLGKEFPTRLEERPQADPISASAPGGAHAREPGRGIADIRALIVARRDEARSCYDRALADHPGLEGALVIQWTIDPNGNVSDASVDSSRSQIVDSNASACVEAVIRTIHFAPSSRGYVTTATYPFDFHPRRSPKTTAP
jgi:TonB family protein